MNNQKEIEKQVIDQQKKKVGSESGYLKNAKENLITDFPNWEEIKVEFDKGNGNELEKKFLALHSSSALCVNNFAPFKGKKDRISFFGYTIFFKAQFEKKLSTKISTPNLDFYLENEEIIIGIESKFTEYFNANLSHTKKKLDKYYDRPELKYLKDNFMEDIVSYYKSSTEKMHLDVAQLIKHSIGLINNKGTKNAILVYIYWQPENWEEINIFKKHREEIADFANRIGKYINFKHLSYCEFWEKYENCELLKEHIHLVKSRYNFKIA